MKWLDAKLAATQHTGRTPAWCDVADSDGIIEPAPSVEAMDDCIALTAEGKVASIEYWMNDVPHGTEVEAVCYF